MPAKAKKDKNPEFLNLYQTVADNFVAIEPNLLKIKAAVESSQILNKNTKSGILLEIEDIFNISNEIINHLGKLGRIR